MRHTKLVLCCLVILSVGTGAARASTVPTFPSVAVTQLTPEQATTQVGATGLQSAGQGRYTASFTLQAGRELTFPFRLNLPGFVEAKVTFKGTARLAANLLPLPYDKAGWQPQASPIVLRRIVGFFDMANGTRYGLVVKNPGGGTAVGQVEVTAPDMVGQMQDQLIDQDFVAAVQARRTNQLVEKFAVSPGPGGAKQFFFDATGPGAITVRAYWYGAAKSLKFVLDGPGGKDAPQGGKTGPSPCKYVFNVKPEYVKAGSRWRLTVRVPSTTGGARGFVVVTWPVASGK